jgi:Arc/MetJ-type ribon-helix-helix transcriptional regulator
MHLSHQVSAAAAGTTLWWRDGSRGGSIVGMKLSVSLGEEDVAFLDEYAAQTKAGSRSAVVQRAIELLRASQMEDAYQAAWEEWEVEEGELWEVTAGDGLAAG